MTAGSSPSPTFVSYARRDNVCGWVSLVHDALESALILRGAARDQVFFDTRDIQLFEQWQHTLAWAVRHAKVMLAFVSRAYFASGPCQWEFEEHLGRPSHPGQPSGLITVILEDTDHMIDDEHQAWRSHVLSAPHTVDLTGTFHTAPITCLPDAALAAVEQLADLVEERLGAIARWEANHTNVHQGTARFIGRDAELRQLRGATESTRLVVVHGLGGVGKSELVKRFALAHRGLFPAGSVLLAANGATRLLPLLADLPPGFPCDGDTPAPDGGEVRQLLLRRADDEALLVILDGVNRPELLDDPQLAELLATPHVRVIATTNADIPEPKAPTSHITLGGLCQEDAVALLATASPDDLDAQATAELAGLVAGHALALEHAVVYLSDHPDVTARQYLECLTAHGPLVSDQMLSASHAPCIAHPATNLAAALRPTVESLPLSARLALQQTPEASTWVGLEAQVRDAHPEASAEDWQRIRRTLQRLDVVTHSPSGDARIHPLVAAYLHHTC